MSAVLASSPAHCPGLEQRATKHLDTTNIYVQIFYNYITADIKTRILSLHSIGVYLTIFLSLWKYSVDDEKQTVNIVHKVETSLTIISYYRSWGILLRSWYEERCNAWYLTLALAHQPNLFILTEYETRNTSTTKCGLSPSFPAPGHICFPTLSIVARRTRAASLSLSLLSRVLTFWHWYWDELKLTSGGDNFFLNAW